MFEIAGTVAGILFGALGAWIGLSGYVRQLRNEWQQKLEKSVEQQNEAKVKTYAAERDFQHIKRNFEQCIEAIKLLHQELDSIDDKVNEIKALQTSLTSQINVLLYQRRSS